MTADHPDHTSFFRALATAARGDAEPARGMFLDLADFDAWTERWLALSPDADAMDRVNPAYVPRNHLVEEALTAATDDDLGPIEQLLDVLAAPYDVRPGWSARRAGPRLVRGLPDLLRHLPLDRTAVLVIQRRLLQVRRQRGADGVTP